MSNGAPHVTTTNTGETSTSTVVSPQFSEASAYLAFESQPHLFGLGKTDTNFKFKKWYVDPLFNVRLTSIGVNANAITKDGLITSPDASLLQSQKAVQVQFGGLASVNFGGFGIGKSNFHWGAGPFFKAGFQNVTDSQRATRIWNLRDDLYDTHEVGFRFSLYQREEQSATADDKKIWSPAAFVDFGLGQFQNFETVVGNTDLAKKCFTDPTNPCLAKPRPETEFTVTKPIRLHMEARLYLGYIYVGLDINNGEGPDDMRFIGGVSISLNRFFDRK